MADKSRSLTNVGIFQGLSNRVRLVARLMADKRISPLLKLLPLGSLVYLVVPVDLLPIIPVDDAAILWLGSYLFVELCPDHVVQEHWDQITRASNVLDPQESPAPPASSTTNADVVDAEFREVDPRP
jgi:uncharacterized membrane protein YkvA (DUF1232 family)